MNRLIGFLIEWKIKLLLEITGLSGSAGGVFTVIFFTGDPVDEPSLGYKAWETVLLAGLGGIVGAIGGLIVAILWAAFGKKWFKAKFGIEINNKTEV